VGLRQARESRQRFSLGLALALRALLSNYRREPKVARALAEEAIALGEENGVGTWLAYGQVGRGSALAELGRFNEAIADMEAGIAGFRRIGGAVRLQYYIAQLARGYARVGQREKGLTMLNDALALIERSGQKVDYAEMLRFKGEMLLMHDARATELAESSFRAALEVARAQEARWWELRTSVSLARLLRGTNRCDEARTMLTEIYNLFTEGFDLSDLKDASALLDELRR
jgi:predicted ATPase